MVKGTPARWRLTAAQSPETPAPINDDPETVRDGQLLRGAVLHRRQFFRDDRVVFVENFFAHRNAQHLEPQFARRFRNRDGAPGSPGHDGLERGRTDFSHYRLGMTAGVIVVHSASTPRAVVVVQPT